MEVFTTQGTFFYTKDLETENPKMLLNKHIGIDPNDPISLGIQAIKNFQHELYMLSEMESVKKITILINSPGGSVDDGWNILLGNS